MKKSIIFSVIFTILVILAIIFAITNKKPAETPNPKSSDSTQSLQQSSNSETSGQYTEYSEESFASAKGQKILFFHAPWCPQCRSIEKEILSQDIPSDLTIFKVDYDTNQDLRKKYGVTLQTTFVKIDDNKELIDKYVAYDSPTFESVKTNFINQ